MEKYLKMSDYFEVNLDGEDVCAIAAQAGIIAQCAVAHAINSHDELVAMNKELLAALEEISNLPSYRQDECSEMAREAIAKAKASS